MATGLQLVEKYMDNNTALFLLAFLSMYNFVLYFKVGRYENIFYFIIIYLGFVYLLKNMNMALLLTYVITTLVFSRNIVEGLVTITKPNSRAISTDLSGVITYEIDLSNSLMSLANDINSFERKVNQDINIFKGGFDKSNFNATTFNFQKNQLINDISGNLSDLNAKLTTFREFLDASGATNNQINERLTYFGQQQTKLSNISDDYKGFPSILQSGISTFGNNLTEVQGLTADSIFCAAPTSPPPTSPPPTSPPPPPACQLISKAGRVVSLPTSVNGFIKTSSSGDDYIIISNTIALVPGREYSFRTDAWSPLTSGGDYLVLATPNGFIRGFGLIIYTVPANQTSTGGIRLSVYLNDKCDRLTTEREITITRIK
jgi:hypothetical protein